jgi:hypothetical protein
MGEDGDVTGDPNRSGPAALPPAPLGLDTLRLPDGPPVPDRSARCPPIRSPARPPDRPPRHRWSRSESLSRLTVGVCSRRDDHKGVEFGPPAQTPRATPNKACQPPSLAP